MKLWIQLNNYRSTKVSTEGCENVNDLINACKKEFPNKLESVESPQEISLSMTKGGIPMKPNDPIPTFTIYDLSIPFGRVFNNSKSFI